MKNTKDPWPPLSRIQWHFLALIKLILSYWGLARNIKFCWCLGRIKTTKVLKVHELICQEVDGSSCTFIKWIQLMKYLKKILVCIAKKNGGGNMSRVHESFYQVFETFFHIFNRESIFKKLLVWGLRPLRSIL